MTDHTFGPFDAAYDVAVPIVASIPPDKLEHELQKWNRRNDGSDHSWAMQQLLRWRLSETNVSNGTA